ncbi:MAG: LCCL domain-containing protein [Acidobacteriota bacterium]
MKQCSKCNRTYDDSQAFCLMDGTPLTVEVEQETVARQSPAPKKKSRFLLWLGLVGLVILIGAVAAAFVAYSFFKTDETARTKRQTNVSVPKTSTSPSITPSTPEVTMTPDITPESSPTAESSPKTELQKPTPNTDDADEITPIQWNTSAVSFKNDDGRTYKFRCPPNGTAGSIWGSDIYTADSSICTAAVHTGLFSLADGGVVTIEFRPGRQTYGSTERNGITSNTYGEYQHSFVVR